MVKLRFLSLISIILLCSAQILATQNNISDIKTIKVQVDKDHLKVLNVASTLLVSCVDFRLMEETNVFMKMVGLEDDFDKIALPGASLALVNDQYPYWGKTIMDNIEILQKLHNITQIIFLDHRECGAYKMLVGQEYLKTRQQETDVHISTLNKARGIIKAKYPQLKVYTFLMGLDGVVEQVYEEGTPSGSVLSHLLPRTEL
jgi:hypothetical protein